MRNIFQYPLTPDEAHDVLQRQLERVAQNQSYGGIEGHALTRIAEFLKQNPEAFAEFLKTV